MPKPKLAKKELEHYKELLMRMKESLIHDIKNMAAGSSPEDNDSRDVSGHVQHIADVATDMYDKEFNLGLASKDREVLLLIDIAIKRINDGSFGLCLNAHPNHHLITKQRLEVLPYAEYCRDCQEQFETKKR
ncbi:MAG: hypothetical protein COW13_03455 [Candidatus Omnitrophica bacterium CG12_big_fil_rev_8_21_14_0_65_50_5]|nr:MAG: hypothetical protein COW13_03455 [Candidatus Omnitrophica bacterium CG12_big_fil_rev_8_21_14_0_65_50_5]